jgi:hypothetical protein
MNGNVVVQADSVHLRLVAKLLAPTWTQVPPAFGACVAATGLPAAQLITVKYCPMEAHRY